MFANVTTSFDVSGDGHNPHPNSSGSLDGDCVLGGSIGGHTS